jgi:uncharacterized DUF497 family protein
MGFEWDDKKERTNLDKHGISFSKAAKIFEDDNRLHRRSDRTGETRWSVTGKIDEKLWTVIYTRRRKTLRLISARRARQDEKERYHRKLHDR